MFEGPSASLQEQAVHARRHHAAARSPRRAVLVIAGTRPECIKLAPIVRELSHRRSMTGTVVNSGQHAEAVRRTFGEFGIRCDVDLPPMLPAPNLVAASRNLTGQLRAAIERHHPSLVLVQGDTLTAYAGARAATEAGCPVVHVEAGLRAPTVSDPFPEEWFRRQIATRTHFHFTPCESAHMNLLAEGTPPERIYRVGNTGIDSLRALLAQDSFRTARPSARTQVLVTLHRRENWDGKADIICDALIALSELRPDLNMLVPVHPNPRIAPRIRHRLSGHPRFALVAPMAYREFIAAAANAALVISDSGGIQEEVPHLGVPLLVPRSCTERPEGVATGFVRLVAVDRDEIVREALSMLSAPPSAPLPFDHAAPFGDGAAATRIVDVLEAELADALAA
ncbi:MAG: UDP-N-acetylglucosamine 2-epimerase (non-hydrolyzing) [Casimicrobiaceae bacterium]